MSTIPGITTTTTTGVADWDALGHYFGEMADSGEQAGFLAGMARALGELPIAAELMQLEYIREAVDAHNERAAICSLVHELEIRLNHGGTP